MPRRPGVAAIGRPRLLSTVRRWRHESSEALHLRWSGRRLRCARAKLGEQRGAREEDVGRQVVGGWRRRLRLRGTPRGFADARALPRWRRREARLLAPRLAGDRVRRWQRGRGLSRAAPHSAWIVGGAVVVQLVHRPIGLLGGGRRGRGCWALAEPAEDALGLHLAMGRGGVGWGEGEGEGEGSKPLRLLALAARRAREPRVHAGRELL